MQASFLNWEGSSSDRYNMYIRVDAGVDTDDTDSQILGMMMHGCWYGHIIKKVYMYIMKIIVLPSVVGILLWVYGYIVYGYRICIKMDNKMDDFMVKDCRYTILSLLKAPYMDFECICSKICMDVENSYMELLNIFW